MKYITITATMSCSTEAPTTMTTTATTKTTVYCRIAVRKMEEELNACGWWTQHRLLCHCSVFTVQRERKIFQASRVLLHRHQLRLHEMKQKTPPNTTKNRLPSFKRHKLKASCSCRLPSYAVRTSRAHEKRRDWLISRISFMCSLCLGSGDAFCCRHGCCSVTLTLFCSIRHFIAAKFFIFLFTFACACLLSFVMISFHLSHFAAVNKCVDDRCVSSTLANAEYNTTERRRKKSSSQFFAMISLREKNFLGGMAYSYWVEPIYRKSRDFSPTQVQ